LYDIHKIRQITSSLSFLSIIIGIFYPSGEPNPARMLARREKNADDERKKTQRMM